MRLVFAVELSSGNQDFTNIFLVLPSSVRTTSWRLPKWNLGSRIELLWNPFRLGDEDRSLFLRELEDCNDGIESV